MHGWKIVLISSVWHKNHCVTWTQKTSEIIPQCMFDGQWYGKTVWELTSNGITAWNTIPSTALGFPLLDICDQGVLERRLPDIVNIRGPHAWSVSSDSHRHNKQEDPQLGSLGLIHWIMVWVFLLHWQSIVPFIGHFTPMIGTSEKFVRSTLLKT